MIFLRIYNKYAIIVHNAVRCWNEPWRHDRINQMLCRLAEHFCLSVWRSLLMAVSYKKLWKLLIDKDMKKKDLCAKAGISPASVTKMGRNGHVTTEILLKICTALDCQIEDIIEIIPEHEESLK